jgi:hypothetical protein
MVIAIAKTTMPTRTMSASIPQSITHPDFPVKPSDTHQPNAPLFGAAKLKSPQPSG